MVTKREATAATSLAIEHVLNNGFDDIIKPPMFHSSIELEVMQANPKEFREKFTKEIVSFLMASDLKNQGIGVPNYFLVPKDEFTFRRVAWIDPIDLIKYLAASIYIQEQLESSKPKKSDLTIHSHRTSESRTKLFDEDYGYNSFRKRSGELTKENIGKWKVVTDIASFFDRVGNHPLENNLQEAGCDEKIRVLIREVLFLWSGDRRSFGLPIGSDASRILSEAALLSVDQQLIDAGVQYVRYVDDFRLFADTREGAYGLVQLLTEKLAEEGLQLNNKKTSVQRISSGFDKLPDSDTTIGLSHEAIDEDAKVEGFSKNVMSGRTTISRYYKHPGLEAINRLKALTFEQIRTQLTETEGQVQENAIRDAVKHFIHVDQKPENIRVVLRAKMTSIFYIVDALDKDHDKIDVSKRDELKKIIFEEVGGQNAIYPFKIALIRLAANPAFEDVSIINGAIENYRVTDNKQFFREAILLGSKQISRKNISTLCKTQFVDAQPYLRRAIFYALKQNDRMGEDQKRPLFKNMKMASTDWFINKI